MVTLEQTKISAFDSIMKRLMADVGLDHVEVVNMVGVDLTFSEEVGQQR